MQRRQYLAGTAATVGGSLAGCLGDGGSGGNSGDDGSGDESGVPDGVAVETVAEGLAAPWSIAFPDDESLLVTERDAGRLLRVDRTDGSTTPIAGIPEVDARSQGGLFDLALHPDASWLYFTYAASNAAGETATHLARGRLQSGAEQLTAVEVVHIAEPFVDDTGHYGGRVTFGPDGLVYLTVGDRQFKNFGPDHVSQQLTNELGATLRLAPDGSVPADNPFVDRDEAVDTIYSYGHRNAEGMTVHPETDAVWQSEFGESSGDEINVIERGGNYGWPVADEGCTYGTGEPIGVSHDEREDVVAPVYSWPCGSGGGFPPCGMDFYAGSAFPDWQGDLFVGGLASQYVAQFAVDGRDVRLKERLLADRGWRFRDVAVGPDDAVYLAIDADPAPIVRLVAE